LTLPACLPACLLDLACLPACLTLSACLALTCLALLLAPVTF